MVFFGSLTSAVVSLCSSFLFSHSFSAFCLVFIYITSSIVRIYIASQHSASPLDPLPPILIQQAKCLPILQQQDLQQTQIVIWKTHML